jgi:adenylate cyclase
MERRLAAIVCPDVAGYSRMMGADEEGTHATFKAHRSAVYPVILNHGGRLVKNTGDGFLLEYPSVVGALRSSIEIQALMAERNAQLPPDRLMLFRPSHRPYGHRGESPDASHRPRNRCDLSCSGLGAARRARSG